MRPLPLAISWLMLALLPGCQNGGRVVDTASADTHANAIPLSGEQMACDWILTYPLPEGNSAYPDTHTRYWYAALDGRWPAGSRLVIDGQFPQARYSAFHLYDGEVFYLDAIADFEMQAQSGEQNPFASSVLLAPQAQHTGHYQIQLPLDGTSAESNNTLQRDRLGGQLGNRLLLAYRLYLPEDGNQGGVALPQLSLQWPDGQTWSLHQGSRCSDLEQEIAATAPGTLATLLANTLPAPRQPQLRRADAGLLELLRQGIGYNPHNAFLRSKTDRNDGDVILIRGRHIPHTPDADALLRYWSICQYGAASTRVYGCIADQDSVMDLQGYFTIAITSDAQQPAYLVADRGFSWLPWGDEDKAIVLMRQLLALPAVEQLDWAPEMTYCDSQTLADVASQGAAQAFELCRSLYSTR